MPRVQGVANQARLIRYTSIVGKHVAMAIAQWKPAEDGDGWAKITAAWLVLCMMVAVAAELDRRSLS